MTNTPLRPARSTRRAAPRPPKSRSRRRKVPRLVGGLLALVASGVAIYVVSSGAESPAPQSTNSAAAVDTAPDSVPPTWPTGVTAREGTLSITVAKTECGVTQVGPPDLPAPAEGEFCLISMSVRNTGPELRLLNPGAQRAIDQNGRFHRVAEQAAVLINDQHPALLDELPPGETREGVLPFDVPKGVRLTDFLLHESPHSTGVRVPLAR